MNKLNDKLLPLKKQKLSKKYREKEVKIKRNLKIANQNWKYWGFQKHWNKVEWVNSRSRTEQKIHLVCLLKIYLKDN